MTVAEALHNTRKALDAATSYIDMSAKERLSAKGELCRELGERIKERDSQEEHDLCERYPTA